MSLIEKSAERELLDTQINIVVDYLEDNDIVVEFGGKINGFFYEDGLITITNKQSVRSKFYTLLHEAGHFLLRVRDRRFVNSVRDNRRKSKSRRVEIVHEEFLAWDAGLELARELKLHVDEAQWATFSRKHLFDYIAWAHDPLRFGEKK